MNPMNITRRSALQRTAVLSAGVALSSIPNLRAADAAGRKLKVAVVALGRGMGHVQALLSREQKPEYPPGMFGTRVDA